MMARMKTEMLVGAALRIASGELIDCVVLRRGNAEAGAILVHIDDLDGRHRLLARALEFDGSYGWRPVLAGPENDGWASGEAVETRLRREMEIDPDAWVLAIQDAKARNPVRPSLAAVASQGLMIYKGMMNSDTTSLPALDRRLCVAPMMDWTDRHCRHFHRHIAPGALLFTEMVTADAVIHGDRDRLLAQASEDIEDGVAAVLQLGGSDPAKLAEATRIAVDYGYAEINLNVGCPSDRVQSGRFGACLMAEPGLVAACMTAMKAATDLPVTVKCRIGIDDMDPEAGLDGFIDAVAAAGVTVIYLHARKAWLNGLSPKENRDIPPLDYDRAARLAERRPDLDVILNGGLDSVGGALGRCRVLPVSCWAAPPIARR
jgi:hypothetical protein